MHGFEKVVLSRKGFDSSAGGCYSPYDPTTGNYIVLPIPMDSDERKISNPLRFEDIRIKGDHLSGFGVTNLKDLMVATGRELVIKKRSGYVHSDYAHLA